MSTPLIQQRRVENPSESAALHGQKAKTPIIAGSVSGACVLLAWTIGFIIFFVRRRKQRRRAREAGFKSHRDIIDFTPVPNAATFIIPPDPALVDSQQSYEKHIRDLEHQGELSKSPVSDAPLRAPNRPERETTPEESPQTNSTTNSTPVITTMSPSTADLGTVESSYPMLGSSSRLPLTPLTRKSPADRSR